LRSRSNSAAIAAGQAERSVDSAAFSFMLIAMAFPPELLREL
jgi:hypothetical protein